MSEVNKIARFVGIEACNSIFSEKSTFVLRSLEHYIRLYETDGGASGKGDRDEGCSDTTDNKKVVGNTDFVISCWTILDQNKPTSDEWGIFKKNNQNIVAIVSTPSKVCKFLEEKLETDKECSPFRRPVKHDKVKYGEPIAPSRIIDDGPFQKKLRFTNQKEYRFVLKSWSPHLIDSLIFCGGIDYMEQCFVNPTMCKEQKEKLQDIIQKAGVYYGDFHGKQPCDIIANVDVLF